jgi:hypothetical protein
MVIFSNQNPNLGKLRKALEWKMLVYFMVVLEHFTAVCYNLWPLGNLVYFSPFWHSVSRKIWQPWFGARRTRVY